MQAQEVGIKPTVKVIMKSDAEMLDEVMVVAYGTAKKSAFTGSASTIKADKLAERQVSNITNALSGQVAGVQTTSGNGQPGTGSTVRIRGIGSISASNNPLYVVDGVPYDGDISAINSQDIESMTVLKDAASNALYGARGANGVILVTTKKGASGKAVVNVDAKWGTNRRGVPSYDVMTNANQYVETYYKAMLNGWAGGDPNKIVDYAGDGSVMISGNNLVNALIFGSDYLGHPIYTTPNGENVIGMDGKINPNAKIGSVYGDYYVTPDDWEKELFDNSNLRQEYNVSISGSSDKMTYYMSAGYLDDSGIIPGSGYSRLSTRLKADYKVQEWLKVGANFSYANVKSRYPDEQTKTGSSMNLFYITNNIAPIYPLYIRNADGSIKQDSRGYTMYDYGNGMYNRQVNGKTEALNRPFLSNSNPASSLQLDKREFLMDILSAKGFVEIEFMPGLKATGNWGMDLDNTRYSELVNPYYGQYASESVGGLVSMEHSRTFSVNQQYLLTYKNNFGIHNIDLLAGFESYNYKSQYLSGSKQKLYNPTIIEINNAIKTPAVYSATTNYATQGFLARAQYDYDSKYFASASYRRDASSRFHPDHRWGNFWSVGTSWLLNKEAFMSDLTWIDMLKFKASYGVQGNDNIGNYYAYQDQYSVSNSNDDFSVSLAYKGNKNITWETSHSFNTGFDFEFFDQRLNGTIEYFSRKTTDMLYNKPVNPSVGYSAIPMNVGSMINRGVELDLNGDIIRTNDITWSVNFNLTHFKNKIQKLHPDLNGELIDGSRIYQEGESMYQFYLRKYAGVDEETGVALYYKDITDANGNVTGQEKTQNWSDATRHATGDILPKVYGGFGTRLNVYGFDFAISLAYQLGGRVYDNGYVSLMHAGDDPGQNWHKDILNAWTPENKTSNIPQINVFAQYANSLSDRFLTSSDYLSINNITVGYTLPKNWTRKMLISSMRIYMAADNVALFSARKGLDPRQSYTASSADVYSPIRTISGGITLSF